MAPLPRLVLFATALALAFLSTEAFADDVEVGSAIGQATGPDDLAVKSEDANALQGRGKGPDDLVVGSEGPDGHLGGGEDPDALEGHGRDVDDLPRDSGAVNQTEPMPELVPAPPAPGPNDGPEVLAAWRSVQAAERNLEAASDSYTNMIANDYPRGEARQRIIEDRRAAVEGVNRARLRYAKIRGE